MDDEIEVVKATAESKRNSMQAAQKLCDVHIEFIPIPVISDGDRERLGHELGRKLELIARLAEEAERDG